MVEENSIFSKVNANICFYLGDQTDWTLESESNESVKFKERLGIIGPGLDELSRGGVPSAT